MRQTNRVLILSVALLFAVATVGCGDLMRRKKRGSRGRAVAAVTAGKVAGTSFVTNVVKGEVSVVDNVRGQVTRTIQVGSTPTAVAFTPNGQEAWVTRFAASDVAIVNTASGTLTGSVSTKTGGGLFGFLNWGIGANSVAFSPDGKFAYVANFITANVTIIDTATKLVVDTIRILPNGFLSSDIAITPDGKTAVVTNLLSGNVSVLDLVNRKVAQNVTVATGPMSVTISPDGRYAYVACAIAGSVARIDLATKAVLAIVESGVGTADVAVSADSIWTYATNFISGDITVIDNRTNLVAHKVLVGSNLQSILSMVGLGGVAQSQGTQNLFSQFLKYLGSSGGGLSTVFSNVGVNPSNQNGGGSQTILQVLLGAFLQFLGVQNTTTQQILGGTLQGVLSMGIGLHGISMVPGSNMAVVTNFLSGNVSVVDTTTRQVTATQASAKLGANAVAITLGSVAPGATPAPTPTVTPTPTPAPTQPTNPTPTPSQVTMSAPNFPATVALNDSFTISWDVAGANQVTHANIHLDDAAHSAAEWETGIGKWFGDVKSGSSGSYANDFVAPAQATTFYFVVHVQADGQDYYSPQYSFEAK